MGSFIDFREPLLKEEATLLINAATRGLIPQDKVISVLLDHDGVTIEVPVEIDGKPIITADEDILNAYITIPHDQR